MRLTDLDSWSDRRIHDLLGVGFGPSNLALAVAMEEHNDRFPDQALTAHYCERQPTFGWHTGMLLEGATMQVSFLKDLVTMRDPTSHFSFLRYLFDHGRLPAFINHKVLFPSRIEFADYLGWVARQLDHVAVYSAEVIDVRPVGQGVDEVDGSADDGPIELLDVFVRRPSAGGEPETETYRTRNLVVAAGLVPTLPKGVALGPRTWHSSELLDRLATVDAGVAAGDDPPASFVVVGSGQSAAEVTEHLHARFPAAQVYAVFGKYGYCPADDSPFVNQIFDPEAVDQYFTAGADVRRRLMADHRATNYSVVDLELIETLYRRQYHEKVVGVPRLHTLRSTELAGVSEGDDSAEVDVTSLLNGERRRLRVDVVVCATGYEPADTRRLLGAMADRCHVDARGLLRLGRDYRIVTDDCVVAGIYVQGATEHTHGISSTLLSNTAVRAGEILASVLAPTRVPVTQSLTKES